MIHNDTICESGKLLQATIETDQIVEIDVWYYKNFSDYKANCYFWCQSDHSHSKLLSNEMVHKSHCKKTCEHFKVIAFFLGTIQQFENFTCETKG